MGLVNDGSSPGIKKAEKSLFAFVSFRKIVVSFLAGPRPYKPTVIRSDPYHMRNHVHTVR